jgi:hypothetical protein
MKRPPHSSGKKRFPRGESGQPGRARFPSVAGLAAALLLMAGLVWFTRPYTQPLPGNQARIEERKRVLLQLNADNQKALETCEWLDRTKGLVRLPIARAMELTVQYWQNPAAGRSNLLARVQRPPAKPAPTINP